MNFQNLHQILIPLQKTGKFNDPWNLTTLKLQSPNSPLDCAPQTLQLTAATPEIFTQPQKPVGLLWPQKKRDFLKTAKSRIS